MARRRSLNRRSSLRKSLNVTELDDDSELIDADIVKNPQWWKNIADDMTVRPSLPGSAAETTGPILDDDSRVDTAELHDNWFEDLDRTKVRSSRRFSVRTSLNPGDTPQESFVSEGDDDVSIKKRKVLLRPKDNKREQTENFLRALNDSDAAQSEPVLGKRKSHSPTRSDTANVTKKSRTRRSRTAEISRDDREDTSITSNESDIVVKQRPQLFKKRFTSKLESRNVDLQNEEAGPSGINTSKRASRHSDSSTQKNAANVTFEAIDSNESGIMGPPKSSASHRKRLSSISRKLNLTSDESGSEGSLEKANPRIAKRSRKRSSINPFEKIVLAHIEGESLQSEKNKNSTNTKTPRKSRHIDDAAEDDNQSSTIVNESDSASKTQIQEFEPTQQDVTVDLVLSRDEGTENLVEKKRRSTSVTKEIPRSSKKLLKSKDRSTLLNIRESRGDDSRIKEEDQTLTKPVEVDESVSKTKLPGMQETRISETNRPTISNSEILQDLESGESENENIFDGSSRSKHNTSKETLSPKKSVSVTKPRSFSTRSSVRQRRDDSEEESNDEQDIIKGNRSLRSASHSRVLAESAYELPDKERSDSPIISLSESEDDKSVDKSKRNKRGKELSVDSKNRSIPIDKANVSRQSSARMNASPQKVDSDESISKEKTTSFEKSQSRSTKRHSHVDNRVNISGKRAKVSPQQTINDDSLNEDDAQDKAKNTSKSAILSTKKKHNTARKSFSYGNTSRRLVVSEESSSEVKTAEAEKSISESTTKKNSSRQRIESDVSISEEEMDYAEKSRSESARMSILGRRRYTKAARNRSVRVNVSGQGDEHNDSRDAVNSKSANQSVTRKADDARNSSAAVFAQRDESGKSEEGELFVPRKSSAARKSLAPRNVSDQRIESDENSSEENAAKSPPKSTNSSAKNKMSISQQSTDLGNVSEQLVESDEHDDAENVNSITAKGERTSTLPTEKSSIAQSTMNRSKSRLSNAENFEGEDSTIPSEAVPIAAPLTKLPSFHSDPTLRKSDASRTQKNITDFFPSNSQRLDRSRALNQSGFDPEQLKVVMEKMEKLKQKELAAMGINMDPKKKDSRRPDNASKAKASRSKENMPKAAAKPPKVVNRAYIVNGAVYKQPRLPRPKPWVTNRLYKYLWKKLEPKYDMRTRVKSEKFVVQLAEVVAIVMRRKKYENYKLELDELMKYMAKLGIIKTRHDFYDFCYDFLPYEFREKATPILLPGNVNSIPYNPSTLNTPLLPET